MAEEDPDFRLQSPPRNLTFLASLMRLFIRWYTHPTLIDAKLMRNLKNIILGLVASALFLGDAPIDPVVVLAPAGETSYATDDRIILLVSVRGGVSESLLVSTQWEDERFLPIGTQAEKESIPKTFFSLFGTGTTIERIIYTFHFAAGAAKPETLQYRFVDSVTIRAFWQMPEFTGMIKRIQATKAGAVHLSLRGWHDSVMTTDYLDPIQDDGMLYKIAAPLLWGENTIGISAGRGRRGAIVRTVIRGEAGRSLTTADQLFHNSSPEQSCTPCHQGLPSENGGLSMTAECWSCHTGIKNRPRVHAVVGMNECASCHAWSAERGAITVPKGVPESCYDCHESKRSVVESSPFPHIVAGDCSQCHTPHSSTQPALLHRDVYQLCISCHESYKEHHPVSRHPVRFSTLRTGNQQEISCVSCHQPHGSENPKLLPVGGGRMAVCLNCHS